MLLWIIPKKITSDFCSLTKITTTQIQVKDMDNKKKIARTVLAELDSFDKNFSVKEYEAPIYNPLGAKEKYMVYENQKHLLSEPFTSYVKVREKVDNGDWHERVYLVCRNYLPSGIDPVSPSGAFLNRNAPLGRISSADVGDEIEVTLPNKKLKTLQILEKNNFIPVKESKWDAKENKINYEFEKEFRKEFLPSLRELFPLDYDSISSQSTNIDSTDRQLKGLNLVKELEEAKLSAAQNRELKKLKKLKRNRSIVDSIALKDEPNLDKFQDVFTRNPLNSQTLLIGSPGTGKTTSLIKRIAFKSDSYHLETTDEIVLEDSRLRNWLMFTPNELLKSYLKEAMNKEGLSATDNKVVTWDKERTNLGRDVLKFLKSAKSGIFVKKSGGEILTDNSSSGLTTLTEDFLRYFNDTIQKNFFDAIALLERYKPSPDIISKENSRLAQNFNIFIGECKRVKSLNETRKISDADIKTIFLVEDFQKLKPQLTQLRGETSSLIKEVLDELISSHPEIIDQVSEIIKESKTSPLVSEDIDLIESQGEDDVSVETEDEESLDTQAEIDEEIRLKIESRKKIRQTLMRFAESQALKRIPSNKRFHQILRIITPFLNDKRILSFIGHINLALKQRIFGHLDYSRIIEQIPVTYDKFRLDLMENNDLNSFRSDSLDSIKAKKITHNEVDILIYVMLRFAGKIFQERRDFLRNDMSFDLLENIKEQYRTQIAVDEAADFSAVQLGCMYQLAHPEFKSVSFAGDLMQRVTQSGLTEWSECEFISDSLKKQELIISYRQTPILLEIAGKLYENVIGQKPPFHSHNVDDNQDPRPLKYKAEHNESLGEWIAGRIQEIYEINGSKLPSIAVFVPEENDIDPTCQIIEEKLNEISIEVEKCKEGKVLGTDSKVRIFSVEYIKGLEFEGVFFLGIDAIYDKTPDLLDKYLYVGLTRATTFLGVTYSSQFPKKISCVENSFHFGNWSEFID